MRKEWLIQKEKFQLFGKQCVETSDERPNESTGGKEWRGLLPIMFESPDGFFHAFEKCLKLHDVKQETWGITTCAIIVKNNEGLQSFVNC